MAIPELEKAASEIMGIAQQYFDQRRYSISPVGDGTYYLHDTEPPKGRYPRLVGTYVSVYSALKRFQQLMRTG